MQHNGSGSDTLSACRVAVGGRVPRHALLCCSAILCGGGEEVVIVVGSGNFDRWW